MNYNEVVESCFFEPHHVGVLDCTQAFTVCGKAGTQEQYDLYLQCDETGKIIDSAFKAYGNPYLVAGVEWICRQLKGSNINQHPYLDYKMLVQELAIPKNYYPIALLMEKGYKNTIALMKKKFEGEDND